MRIADKMQFSQINTNVQKNRSDMSELQNQAATQRRLNRPSDDPLGTTKVLSLRTEEQRNDQFVRNIDQARGFLEYVDQSLGELTDVLIRAKELAISQSHDAGVSPETRAVVSREVEQLRNQALQLANRRLGDRYIFGGYQTIQKPFDSEGNYLGDDGEIKLAINKDAYTVVNLPGNRIFLGQGVTNDGYSRQPENPLPLSSSLLEEYKISEADRSERNEEWLANDVHVQGQLNQRGGNDRIQNGNASDEMRHPAEESEVNIFSVMKALEVALRTSDKEGVQDSLEDLDRALQQATLLRSEVGVRVMALNSQSESLHRTNVDLKGQASRIEDADAYQVVSEINKADNTLKASLATSGKLVQTSLLDFLK